MANKPEWINEYASIVDSVRDKISEIAVIEEITFRYAIIRLFARATLSMCEIHTLMNNGYPESAFALARQIYEAIVLMDYLTTNRNDETMVERYFDDIEITKIKIQMEIEKYTKDDIRISAADELDKYVEKYRDFYDEKKGFTDYWWFKKKGSFSDVVKETKFSKYYMYKETSSILHMSIFNSTTYVGRDQNGILIGETYDGIDKAGWYSMLCFSEAMKLLGETYNVDLNDLITRGRELSEKIRKQTMV